MKSIKLRALVLSKVRAAAIASSGAALLAIAVTVTAPVHAATGINKMLSFQGKVVNSNGTNVSDNGYIFRFRIYSSASADSTSACSPGVNSCMWEESKTISTVNGIFQTDLGSFNPLPGSVDFNSDSLYLGVVFNGDTEMTPRIRLDAVPYAFNASKLGGLDASSFVVLSPTSQQSGSINVSGNIQTGGTFQGNALDAAAANAISIGAANATAINIGKTAGGTALNVTGTATFKPVLGFDSQTAYQFQNSGGFNLLNVDTADGYVGISSGTSTLQYPLDVRGDAGIAGNLQFFNGGNHTLEVAANTAAAAGYNLTVKGGNAGSGNNNGGNLVLTGGTGSGTGARGLVQMDTAAFTTVNDPNCYPFVSGSYVPATSSCTIASSSVDNKGAIIVNMNGQNLMATLPNPTNTAPGRVIYVTGASGSSDFTLRFNGGTANQVDVAMKQNTSATLVWNGTAWTAAGASSSTTLQAAYNNTLASAGGAEIVLNNSATSNGLTIRNGSGANAITGPLFEVQSSVGTELLAVNSSETEYASNGGAETGTTFNSNWAALGTGSASQYSYTSNAAYVATGQNSVFVNSAAAGGSGVRNIFSSNLPAAATTYQVSFTAKLDSTSPPLTTLEVVYSQDGVATTQTCGSYSTQQITSSTNWTKVTCTFTSTASASNSQLFIRQGASDTTGHKYYIDNLSVTRNDATSTPANLQVGGGSFGGNVTLFTLDRSSSPPVASGNQTLFGSMYYDTTSGRIQCYQANGWGACGSAPDTFVNLSPEYAGAVLGGPGTTGNGTTSSTTPTGVGTMTAEFCSNQGNLLQINTNLCGTGQAFNYYHWTSPQPTMQTYSIYVTYQLPGGFKKFQSNSTVQLTGRVDDTTNASVTYEMFKSQSGQLTRCYDQANLETNVITQNGTITAQPNTWVTAPINGDEASPYNAITSPAGCDFSTSSANNFVIFKINMKAKSNANAYVGALSFTITNQ